MIPVGSRSLLFGVHQFALHPFFVLIAWIKLYGWPSWRELICIVVHDWGYLGKPNMDGAEGMRHPEFGAYLVNRLFGSDYFYLILLHSRHYAKALNEEPSKLCWADKLSIAYEPWWLYIPRAWASGELKEYRQLSSAAGITPLSDSHRQWFKTLKRIAAILVEAQRGDAAPYLNASTVNR